MAGSAGIENSYLVQGLKTNEMRLFLKCFREESYSAGSYIFKENDEGDTLYVAESGTVSLRQWIMPGGVEKTILTAERGGVFGEISFMDRRGRSASALVEEDAVVHVLSRSDFEEFTREYPGAGLKVLDSLLCIVVVRLRVTNEAYREALQQGLHVIGGDLLNFQHLIAQSVRIRMELLSGKTVNGMIIQVIQSNAGHEVVVRDGDGNLIMIPYHAIASIAFDIEAPVKRVKKRRKR